jgi:uncharacterized protein with HEPN domain
MPSRPEDLYLTDIVEACHDVRQFIGAKSADEWYEDKLCRYAVLARLIVVGEAANRLSSELRSRHTGVPWREIVGFRNVAVHEYFAVEWHVVWRIANRGLPELNDQAQQILRAEFPDVAARLEERLRTGE